MTESIKNVINCCIYLSIFVWCQNALALANGDALYFDDASYFGVEVAPGVISQTPIVSHDGIIIGQEQPADGSHSGTPDGTENPSIDEPWAFFGNTGMFQTVAGSGGASIVSNDNNGNFELDFTGFGMTWNGIPNIDLGGSDTIPSDTGVATLSCSTAACSTGSTYVLDYAAHVPDSDPSNFGGVLFVVHLEGIVAIAPEILSLEINVPGGPEQECSEHGGAIVEMNATAQVPDGDTVESITWMLDGFEIGTGESVSPLLDLGVHAVTAILLTGNGLTAGDAVNVTIEDTVRPEAVAQFLSVATGKVVTRVGKGRRIKLRIGANDVCDPAPVVTYSEMERNNSVTVEDGDRFLALPNGKTNIYKFEESLRLSVSARDATGNIGNTTAILNIIE